MRKHVKSAAALTLAASLTGAGVAAAHASQSPSAAHSPALRAEVGMLEDPSIIVAWSKTDRDAQVLIDIGATVPLAHITVADPHGTTILDSTFTDSGGLGQDKIFVETPEPTMADLKAAYPAGKYHITATLTDATTVEGDATLTYQRAGAARILSPKPGARLAEREVVLRWGTADRARLYHLEIERFDGVRAIKIDLPPNVHRYKVPAAFLQSGEKYTADVKVVDRHGNESITDVTFRVR